MNRIQSREVMKSLSQKHNIPIEDIYNMIKSQFEFVACVMKQGDYAAGDFKNVFISNFGRFVVSPFAYRKMEERKAGKTTDIQVEGDTMTIKFTEPWQLKNDTVELIDDTNGQA